MDEDSRDHAERLQAEYQSEAPEPPDDVLVPDVFWYIHFKAFAFLRAGPDEYRKHDALQQPPVGLPATRMDAIRRGCEQIMEFRGLSSERPLHDIGLDGLYALIRLFHFESHRQSALRSDMPDVVVDEMQLTHVVDGRELTLYNGVKVKLFGEKADTGGPCPYCGEPLRTAFAKQCRHCGADWHDPANVVFRRHSQDS
jgi:hypothetical protein